MCFAGPSRRLCPICHCDLQQSTRSIIEASSHPMVSHLTLQHQPMSVQERASCMPSTSNISTEMIAKGARQRGPSGAQVNLSRRLRGMRERNDVQVCTSCSKAESAQIVTTMIAMRLNCFYRDSAAARFEQTCEVGPKSDLKRQESQPDGGREERAKDCYVPAAAARLNHHDPLHLNLADIVFVHAAPMGKARSIKL